MSLEIQNKERIFGLDLVRATAILFVLFSHCYYLIDSSNPFLISISGIFGFAGVELFFVLSGFLIGALLLKGFMTTNFTFSDVIHFIKRRWFRTLPNYYFVLLLNVILAFLFDFSLQNVWKYFFFIQNFSSNSISFFPESWSLSIEEWTYILVPMVLLFSWKIFKNKKVGFLMTTLFLIVFFHFLRYYSIKNNEITDMTAWNDQLKSIVIYRVDSIVFGFLLAWIYFFYMENLKKISVYLLILSVHLFFLQYVVLNVLGYDINSKPIYFNVFYFTLSSMTFVLALPVFLYWKKSTAWFSKPITFLSKISYSMYLLHYSIISFLMKYVLAFLNFKFSSSTIVLMYVLITFTFSYLLYRFFEKPMMEKRE